MNINDLEKHLSWCNCCKVSPDLFSQQYAVWNKAEGLCLIWKEFPIHVISRKGKKDGAVKYVKVSGNTVYYANRFLRDIIMRRLKEHFTPACLSARSLVGAKPMSGPFELVIHYATVANHGDVRRVNGKLSWKPATKSFDPDWDLSNLHPYRKCIEDAIVGAGVLPDDTIRYITSISEKFIAVDHIDRRYIKAILRASGK